MKPNTEEREIVFRLLEQNATLGQVAQYLKRKGLHHSAGTWKDLFTARISPALEEEKLTRDDLVELIRMAEEYGTQHVFFYKTKASHAAQLVDKKRVEAALDKAGLASLVDRPRILDQPSSPTIADVRLGESLVAKLVERRLYQRFVDQRTEGEYLVRRYREFKVRAVNVFKLHEDGLLELRIYSHENSSDYQGDVQRMWDTFSFLLSQGDFAELSVANAKTNLWKKRNKLKSVIRYSDSTLRNALGTALSASTGSEAQSLFDDLGASNSLDEFLKHKAYCDTSNLWWLRGGGKQSENEFDQLPSKDIHVFLKGRVNEVVFAAQCSKQDYEYVLDQLRKHNG